MGANRIVGVIALAAILGACDTTRPAAAPIDSATVVCLSEPTVSPPTITMFVGDSAVITVRVPTCADLGSSLVWRSSNAAVASVDSPNGIVRALAVGLASVTATFVKNPAISVSAVVQVKSR